MSHAYAAGGARQTAVLAVIVGLHFAVFLVVATAVIPTDHFNAPEPMPVRAIPEPKKPEPMPVVPGPGPQDDYHPGVYPKPDFPIPDFTQADPRNEPDVEGVAGVTVGNGPVVDYIPPALRTRPANVAAAINTCYPAASRRMNEEGTVVALVTIGAAGSAVNWSVAQSSGFARLDAAIACVLRKLDFVVGRRDGQAVSAEARLPIVFQLD